MQFIGKRNTSDDTAKLIIGNRVNRSCIIFTPEIGQEKSNICLLRHCKKIYISSLNYHNVMRLRNKKKVTFPFSGYTITFDRLQEETIL